MSYELVPQALTIIAESRRAGDQRAVTFPAEPAITASAQQAPVSAAATGVAGQNTV